MIGKRIGNYRVVRQIGRGGMGAVYEAVHDDIGKRVAIKVLHGRFSQDPQVVARFYNEARALTSINHPGIVQIFDFGELDNRTRYIAMEYLEGESLSQRLGRLGQLGVPEAMRLCRQVASALGAAHAQRVIHRDLKPGNIIIVADPEAAGGERAKVFDFGIAKLLDEAAMVQPGDTEFMTRADLLMGTPTYMSPEQCRGAGKVDERTDVYALGIVMYQILSGRPPFIGEGDGDVLAKQIHEAPRPLQDVEPSVPTGLAWMIGRMLSKQSMDRPTMPQVVQELEALGSKVTGAITGFSIPVVMAPKSSPHLTPPTVLGGSSTSQHQIGERIDPPAIRTWSRPPPALWVVAILGVVVPMGVLLKRQLGQPPMVALDGEERAQRRAPLAQPLNPPAGSSVGAAEAGAGAVGAIAGGAVAGASVAGGGAPAGGGVPAGAVAGVGAPAGGGAGGSAAGGGGAAVGGGGAAGGGAAGGGAAGGGAAGGGAAAAGAGGAASGGAGAGAAGSGGHVAAGPARAAEAHGGAAGASALSHPGALASAALVTSPGGAGGPARRQPEPGAAEASSRKTPEPRRDAPAPGAEAAARRDGGEAKEPGAGGRPPTKEPVVVASKDPARPGDEAERRRRAAEAHGRPNPPDGGAGREPPHATAKAPEPPRPPDGGAAEKPRLVVAAMVRKDKTGGLNPQLPASVRSQYRGTGPLTLSYKLCVDRAGRVSNVYSFGSGMPLADEAVMSTLRTWSYRPQPLPICFVETFNFIIE